MAKKISKLKLLRYKFEFFGFYTFSKFVSFIPYAYLYKVSDTISKFILYPFRFYQFKRSGKVLCKFFNNDSKKILKDSSRELLRGLFELFFAEKERDKILSSIDIFGMENLKRALEEKRGVIAFTGHFGNFTVLAMKMSSICPFYTVVKDPKNPYIASYLENIRVKTKTLYIPLKPKDRCTKRIISTLKRNGIVCLIADERRKKGISVPFFGRDVNFAKGPSFLAKKFGSPVVPIFIVRESLDGFPKNVIHIEPPIFPENETELSITQKLSSVLERYIREYPSQWNWISNILE